jgi:DNA-binding transcriptional regulator GbsR (MarR family)
MPTNSAAVLGSLNIYLTLLIAYNEMELLLQSERILSYEEEAVLNEDVAHFVEQLGLFFEAQGLSRTPGRLMGLLLVKPNPLSLDAMAELLQLSKASISTNIRLLEHYGLVERISLPGDRRDHYQLGSDPWERVTAISIERAQRMISIANEGLCALSKEDVEARHRLEEMRRFYSFLVKEARDLLQIWRDEHQPDTEPDQ